MKRVAVLVVKIKLMRLECCKSINVLLMISFYLYNISAVSVPVMATKVNSVTQQPSFWDAIKIWRSVPSWSLAPDMATLLSRT